MFSINKIITNLVAKNAVRRCSNDCHSTSSVICFESFNSCQWAFTKTNWNSRERFEKGRIFYFQKKLADSLNEKLNQIINLHLNLGQNYSIETPQVFLSFESNEFIIIEFKPESNCFISSSFLSLFVFLNSVWFLVNNGTVGYLR